MRLEGIHHITAITADAPRNVEFYTGVLGLRLVKKTVNQDDPTVYHLFYADEKGSPGADLTFFEYPDIQRGHAGAGMVRRIVWRVGSEEALSFWAERLRRAGIEVVRETNRLWFEDPEGLELELRAARTTDAALAADHPEIPADVALQGFDGVLAYSTDPERSRRFLEKTLVFAPIGEQNFNVRGERRGSFYAYNRTSDEGQPGAGTVHHVAWASQIDEHAAWRAQVIEGGGRPTPIIDRFYFRSIYFREPSGVLFEIATIGPGFTTDESLAHLGQSLSLPPKFEHRRAELERILTPLPDPRRARMKSATPAATKQKGGAR